MALIEELRTLRGGAAGQAGVHLDRRSLAGIADEHQVADFRTSDLQACKAVADGRQITRGKVHRLHADLGVAGLQIVAAINVFRCSAQVGLPDCLV